MIGKEISKKLNLQIGETFIIEGPKAGAKVELKVGKILECEPHPKADRLLVFKIDIGDEVITIVSGISSK